MAFPQAFQALLDSGLTTLCHAWAITRADGAVFGFTDHDGPLGFEGVTFRPDTGLSAMALARATGLSVDNTEALGALSHGGISEADIEAGRFDGAEVRAWRVNWAAPEQRALMFRGHIGELTRIDGAFRAEIRGLSAALNRPLGRVFQKPCTAVLGDAACRADLTVPGYVTEIAVEQVEEARVFRFADLPGFAVDWFTRGRLEVLGGAAQGLHAAIKEDRAESGARVVELWQSLRAEVVPGDPLRLVAGCDKRFETCRLKFDNGVNFQGFPDLPEEDWVMVHPSRAGATDGGSRR